MTLHLHGCSLYHLHGAAVTPVWFRNGEIVDTIHHAITSNITDDAEGPVYISTTITVISVTAVDDAALYLCDIFIMFTNNATLTVVGM